MLKVIKEILYNKDIIEKNKISFQMKKTSKNKFLAIIPARGGSVGIKNKNLSKIGKTNLLAQSIKVCRKIKSIEKIIVSTDSKKIANEAIKNKVLVPFMRSKKNSTSKSNVIDAIIETIIKTEKFYKLKFENIMIIEPTSPLRKKNDIEKSIRKFFKKNFEALWTISAVNSDYHPLKQMFIKKNHLNFFSNNSRKITRRQQLNTSYIRNGVCYLFKRNYLMKNKNIYSSKIGYFILKGKYISIDDHKDLKLARKLFVGNY